MTKRKANQHSVTEEMKHVVLTPPPPPEPNTEGDFEEVEIDSEEEDLGVATGEEFNPNY